MKFTEISLKESLHKTFFALVLGQNTDKTKYLLYNGQSHTKYIKRTLNMSRIKDRKQHTKLNTLYNELAFSKSLASVPSN